MDEILNVQTAPDIPENIPEDIPENTLTDEPEYILKKKFCFATIPAIFAIGTNIFASISMIFVFVDYGFRWAYLVETIDYTVQFVSMALLCVFAFAKLNKPFTCIPPFVMALSKLISLVFYIFTTVSPKEFKGSNDYTYADYMTIRIFWLAFWTVFVLSLVVFGVYLILASRKNAGNGVKILWFIPVILSAFSVVMDIAYHVVSFVLCDIVSYGVISGLVIEAMLLAVNIPLFVTFAFFCIWISNPYKKVLKKVEEPEIPVIEETAVDTEEVEEKAEEEQKPAEPIVIESAPVIPEKPVEPKPQTVAPPMPPKPVAPPPVMNQAPVRPVMPPPAMRQPPVRPVAPPPMNVCVPSNQETTMAQKNNIELIKQYKELLDMGAITQEEYDEKKKELLTNK